jgi:lipoprotein-releasing system permease protein
MNLSFDIAIRYLFGKKSTNAINLITGISIIGMTIGTAALILILSVFNGFEEVISDLFNSYNPDIKVVPAKGQLLDIDSSSLLKIKKINGIDKVCQSLNEVVLFEYEGVQEAGYIKGVDQYFNKVTEIDSTIVRGEYLLKEGNVQYAVLGSGMFNKLSINPSDPLATITVYGTSKKSSTIFGKDYNTDELYPAGVFSVGSEDDGQYILADIDFVRNIINNESATSALEIKLKEGMNDSQVITEIKNILGSNVVVKNRYMQDEAFLKIMNIEKWISFLIACLTLALISFNMVGALWMIVLDKKKDISVLKAMGFTNINVKSLIIRVGIMIGAIGFLIGISLASIFYFIQKNYSVIAVPDSFMIDAYPIAMKLQDVVLVFSTVVVISVIASLLPAFRAAKISAYVRYE